MSEFDDGWMEYDDDYLAHAKAEAEQRSVNELSYDYYEDYPPHQPKFEIGQYVADQGFSVPLINDQAEWERAFDEGKAMLRSEMPQDYDGLSGLLPSEVLANSLMQIWVESNNEYASQLGKLVLDGLRNGDMPTDAYMNMFRGEYRTWSYWETERTKSAAYFGALDQLNIHSISASKWRYIEGTNVSVFADPHIAGRYHFGVLPFDPANPDGYRSIGSYQFDSGEYDTPQQFRKHDVPFVARPFVEYYEQIRSLPRFDNTQCPVLELQQDPEGNIYFLQYLKTGQKQQLTEPFDLPSSDDTFRTLNVRGVTPQSGKNMRMYMAPNLLTKGMEGEAIFCGLTRPRGIEVQFASRVAEFILHEAYISFQNNHFDASPLYRPPLAAGLSNCYHSPKPVLQKVGEIVDEALFTKVSPFSREIVPYIDIKVTSNGHEAAIESDWDVKTIAYEDIQTPSKSP